MTITEDTFRPVLKDIRVAHSQNLFQGEVQLPKQQGAESPLITPAGQQTTPMWPTAFRWSGNGFGSSFGGLAPQVSSLSVFGHLQDADERHSST